jgi:hypothetical protein
MGGGFYFLCVEDTGELRRLSAAFREVFIHFMISVLYFARIE